MIPIQFKDTVARKYGYKHFQELLGVYFKCTKTRIQAMTVKELKQRLQAYPDHMYVFIAERKTEFTYGLVNSVTTKEIAFKESPDDEVLATDTVVIIDEE